MPTEDYELTGSDPAIPVLSGKANNGGCVIFGLIGSPAWAEWEGGLGGLPETPGRTAWRLLAEIR